jgi:M6 family metalloprotease-like protein
MSKLITFIIISLLFIGCSGGGSSSSSEPIIENNETVPTTVDTYIPLEDLNATTDTNSTDIPLPVAKSTIPMLSILISYNNASITSSQAAWSSKLFGENSHELNNYYLEASNRNFEFAKASESGGTINDGIVSVHLNKNHPNTDIDNFTLFATNVYPDLKNALIALDNVIDFSNYDSNADGHITPDELLLTFIMAGYEDAYEGRHVTNGVWAHQYCMTSSSNVATLDNVTLMGCTNDGNFALFGERHNISNPHDATIGIIAHELGHSAFHLPDLYNTRENTGGIGYFGLMGAGTWARQNSSEYFGATPTHFSAWSKYYNGWVTPKTVSGSTTLTETSSTSYDAIKIPINATSYYLLENRNNSGYDKGLYSLTGTFGGGMAIWKIDETRLTSYYFDNNIVNADTANKAVDLVEARPGTIDSLASGGDEDALFYLGNVANYGTIVTNISARDSVMGLNVN